MAISARPKAATTADVDALINRGLAVQEASVEAPVDPPMKNFTLTVPADVVNRLDQVAKSRRPKVSRNYLIVEAIMGRLGMLENENGHTTH